MLSCLMDVAASGQQQASGLLLIAEGVLLLDGGSDVQFHPLAAR